MKRILLRTAVFVWISLVLLHGSQRAFAADQFKNVVKEFGYLDRKMNFSEMLDFAKQNFKGDKFLTRQEANEIVEKIKKTRELLRKPQWFILYFFSTSVPKRSLVYFLQDVAILQSNGVPVDTKQYLIGFPSDFRAFLLRTKDAVDKYLVPSDKNIAYAAQKNFHLKLGPDFFRCYGIKKVPAIALAKCSTVVPTLQSCKTEYLAVGDMPLSEFFLSISKKGDKRFDDWYFYLIANKIHKKH